MLPMSYLGNRFIGVKMGKVIFISNDKKAVRKIKSVAVKEKFDYSTYTEEEWATFEDIEHYLNGDDPRDIPVLPVGSSPLSVLDVVEIKTIKKVMAATGGNVSQASGILNIGRATLYRKLERLQLDLKDVRSNKNSETEKKSKQKNTKIASLDQKRKEKQKGLKKTASKKAS